MAPATMRERDPVTPSIGGRVRLTHVLAEGGMGVVWAGHHDAIALDVAVKLTGRDHPSEIAGCRLQREARVAARHRHPALVRVFDFGRTDAGEFYLVMERLHGGTLANLLEREGPITPSLAVRVLLPIASALETLHRSGVVHRDIKPANIVLAVDDSDRMQPKLLDFGISQLDDAAEDVGLAAIGDGPVGTPGFLPPEQALREATDGRADVWGLCVTLFVAIAGKTPFGGDGIASVVATRAPGGAVDTARSCPAVPPKLATIMDRGLASLPANRWPSMVALRRALADWLDDQGVATDVAGVALSEYVTPARPSQRPAAPEASAVDAPRAPKNGEAEIRADRAEAPRGWRRLSVRLLAIAGVALRATAAAVRGSRAADPRRARDGPSRDAPNRDRMVGDEARSKATLFVATGSSRSVARWAPLPRLGRADCSMSAAPASTGAAPHRIRIELDWVRVLFDETADPAYVAALAHALR